jgi:hypothetical protein
MGGSSLSRNQNYSMHAIAEADDVLDADGKEVLDFCQAQEARAIFVRDRS